MEISIDKKDLNSNPIYVGNKIKFKDYIGIYIVVIELGEISLKPLKGGSYENVGKWDSSCFLIVNQ